MHISGQTKSDKTIYFEKYCIGTFASCYHLQYLCSRGFKRIDLADFTRCRINLHGKSICRCKSYLSSPKVLILKPILNLQDLDGVKKVWSWCCLFWRKALCLASDCLVDPSNEERVHYWENCSMRDHLSCMKGKVFLLMPFVKWTLSVFFLTLNFSYFCLIFLLLHNPILYNRKSCLVFYLYSRQ